MQNVAFIFRALGLLIGLLAAGCSAPGPAVVVAPTLTAWPGVSTPAAVVASGPSAAATSIAVTSAVALPPTGTPIPPTSTLINTPAPSEATATITPVLSGSATPTTWPTVTLQVLPDEVAAGLAPCAGRTVDDGLLTMVTQQFGLPETFVPPDLVPLSDYFTAGVTVGIPSTIRAGLIEPLRLIIDAMHAAELAPSVLSGYRGYADQYLAWKWWNSQYPERVAIMSARAGHSEHQLGTTVDFGSPELDHLFHVDFADTAEGLWLAENAHRYGFTMSYPADSYAVTGFKYEPWHFRYVGIELATALNESGQILTEWQLANLPPPCIP